MLCPQCRVQFVKTFLHESFSKVTMSFSTLTSSKSKPAHVEVACHECFLGTSRWQGSLRHHAAFNLRSFLHESVFILLFIEGHSVFLHFDTAHLRTRFTREPLVTKVSWENLTVASIPVKHSAAFNLQTFLHESVFFILLFIEGHKVFLHLGIAQVKTRSRWEPLVTTLSVVNLTVALSDTVIVQSGVLPPRECLHPHLHRSMSGPSSRRLSSSSSSMKVTMSFSTLTSPRSKHASRGSRWSRLFLC